MKLRDQKGRERSAFQEDGTVCTKPGFEREHDSFKEPERWSF